MSEEMNLADFSVGGEALFEQQAEPTNDGQATQEGEETQPTEKGNEPVEGEGGEKPQEPQGESSSEGDETKEVTMFSEEEMARFNDSVSQNTDGTYESLDALVAAHDSLYDKVEELNAQLEEARNAAPTQGEEHDEFIKGLIEYYKETGDVSAYIEAKNVDFTSMSDLDVMRYNMRQQYSDMSEKAFERLFSREVVDKYQLDATRYDEEEVELGEELLKSEATKVRETLVNRQEQFKAPNREPSQDVDSDAQAAEAMAQWQKTVESAQETQSVLNDKRVVIDFNGEAFTYEISDPQSVVDMTIDNNKFFQIFQGEDGQIDYAKWYKVMNYASDPSTFERSLILHGKNLGEKEVVGEIKNPSRPTKSSAPSGGDTKEDFLKAALRAMGK